MSTVNDTSSTATFAPYVLRSALTRMAVMPPASPRDGSRGIDLDGAPASSFRTMELPGPLELRDRDAQQGRADQRHQAELDGHGHLPAVPSAI
ncbi:hypothetical protein GCM10010412_006700 [Nonomuraea recticatena]|uniref:Uncharacterized protein n=1 Tax=Nonomuraea recticatena TaxID=46178 RepID=A0ABN3R6Q4_9ACTN